MTVESFLLICLLIILSPFLFLLGLGGINICFLIIDETLEMITHQWWLLKYQLHQLKNRKKNRAS